MKLERPVDVVWLALAKGEWQGKVTSSLKSLTSVKWEFRMMPSRLISAKEMADAESRSGSNISELAALPTKCAESVSYYKAAAKNKECNRPMELLYYR